MVGKCLLQDLTNIKITRCFIEVYSQCKILNHLYNVNFGLWIGWTLETRQTEKETDWAHLEHLVGRDNSERG